MEAVNLITGWLTHVSSSLSAWEPLGSNQGAYWFLEKICMCVCVRARACVYYAISDVGEILGKSLEFPDMEIIHFIFCKSNINIRNQQVGLYQ